MILRIRIIRLILVAGITVIFNMAYTARAAEQPKEILLKELREGDKALNTAFKEAQGRLDEKGRQALRKEQLDWLKLRDKRCSSSFKARNMEDWLHNAAQDEERGRCVMEINRARAEQMRKWESIPPVNRSTKQAQRLITKKQAGAKTSKKKQTQQKEPWVQVAPGYHKFTLIKGAGVDMCEAYLTRLRKTYFERLPYCGRPENDDVPGFEKLNRVELSAEEIYPLYYRIRGFLNGDQYRYDKQDRAGTTDVLRPENKEREIGYIKGNINNRDIGAYRYDPAVDFDNNQVPDNLLVWKEYRCGSYDGNNPGPTRGSTIVLVLAEDSRSIDETVTKKLIGHPLGGYPEPDGKVFYDKYRPVGECMGLFRYKGVTYFDTFFDPWGDFEGKRKDKPNITETLGVFKREKGQTKQACEYLWEIPYIYDE